MYTTESRQKLTGKTRKATLMPYMNELRRILPSIAILSNIFTRACEPPTRELV